ncbi:DNA-binding NarL/FixJ family response regulator [Bifidobacterium commune]|nr:response regulator transcription factor [Bifidobacterium commune]MBB2955004.1 DNA-binding NarL/FixJ family response regulator [Bifidobacterium commune]
MNETRPIRVLIADDQELVRAGFAMVIDSQDDMEVVGQASSGDEAVALSLRLKPDTVLMDVRMPGTDGIQATKLIVDAEDSSEDEGIRTRVIILTTFDLDEYVMNGIDAGASGFLLKDTEPEILLSSIRTVYQGNAIIAPSATKRLIEKMVEGKLETARVPANNASTDGNIASGANTGNTDTGSTSGNGHNNAATGHNTICSAANAQPSANTSAPAYRDPAVDTLTEREREVLTEIAHGLSNQEIADKLRISLPTVKTHVAHILQKTYSRDRVQAVVFAYDNQLVQPGE